MIKLIDLVGFTKISAKNSPLSIASGGLFESSQTTKKSTTPRLDWTERRNGSTMFLNCWRVNSSFYTHIRKISFEDIMFEPPNQTKLALGPFLEGSQEKPNHDVYII